MSFFEMVNGIASHNISDFNDVRNHGFINKGIFELKKAKFGLLSMIVSIVQPILKNRDPPSFQNSQIEIGNFCLFFLTSPLLGCLPNFPVFFSDASPYDSFLNEVSMPEMVQTQVTLSRN